MSPNLPRRVRQWHGFGMTAPIVLALDASRAACSAAILRDGAIVAAEGAAMARGQSETMMPMVARVLAKADMKAADAGIVAVPVGPGSFTGIRIALAAARGLALATGARIVGIDGFRVALEAAGARRPAVVAIDSGRGDWFARRFARADGDDTAPAQLGADDVARLFPSDAFDLVAPDDLVASLTDAQRMPAHARRRPLDLARLAIAAAQIAARIEADGGGGPDGAALPARPLYIAPPAVTMPTRP